VAIVAQGRHHADRLVEGEVKGLVERARLTGDGHRERRPVGDGLARVGEGGSALVEHLALGQQAARLGAGATEVAGEELDEPGQRRRC
jgi:hypothetical protein